MLTSKDFWYTCIDIANLGSQQATEETNRTEDGIVGLKSINFELTHRFRMWFTPDKAASNYV